MKYQPSKYNIYHESNQNLLIYNTFSSGILELTNDFRKEFEHFLIFETPLSPQLKKNLLKGRMLVYKDENEDDTLKLMSTMNRFNNQYLGLTIAPTMECNFACPYCYEEGRRYNSMTEEIVKEVIKFITTNMTNRQSLSITWYGGEPLIGINTIEKITSEVLKRKYNYSSTMVSNGYLLNRETAKKLLALQISSVQITIDGPPEIHNQRRILKNGSGSFETILTNIEETCDLLNILIRVNVDKDNVQKVDELINCLDQHNLKGKIGLYIAPLDNINDTCNAQKCFTSNEFANEQMTFYNKNYNRGYFFTKVPTPNPGICGAVSESNYIIDPLGDLYKCWDDIGEISERIGKITQPVQFNKNLMKWLNYDCMSDKTCIKCKVLPICMGGCPNRIIKNSSVGRTCHFLRFDNDSYIELIKRKNEEETISK